MKRKVLVGLLAVVLVAGMMSCASFTDNTYKTLYTAGTSYDAAMKSVASLQAQGKITTAQRAEINKYATMYYVAYQASVDAFEVYMKTNSAADKDKLAVALTEATAKLSNLLAYIAQVKGVLK
jgi:GTP cyclohydrolase III